MTLSAQNIQAINGLKTILNANSLIVFNNVEVMQSAVKSVLGQNSKEPLLSRISTETWFDDDSNEETLNVNKVSQQ